MIELFSANTPNGWKISIMLEEIGYEYKVTKVDLSKDEQFKPQFIKLSPFGKIPVIIDHDNKKSIFESGAILMYLAQKTGRLMSPTGNQFWDEMQWLMFQMGHIGPMLGQTHHFVKFNPGKAPYAEERYKNETQRLYNVLDNRLRGRKFICNDYSIVDIATWPWISRYEFQQMDLNNYPRLKDWYMRIALRPAVQKGYAVPQNLPVPLPE